MRALAGFVLYVGLLLLGSPVFESGASAFVKRLSVKTGVAFVLVAGVLFVLSLDADLGIKFSGLALTDKAVLSERNQAGTAVP